MGQVIISNSITPRSNWHEYRVTKYNPNKRNNLGHYLGADEWTCFSEVGEKVSLKKYEVIERNYILSASDLLLYAGITSLKIKGLEEYNKKSYLKEGEIISLPQLNSILQSVLRNEFWCQFESLDGFIHLGYDYYMYVGVSKTDSSIIQKITNRGLFVEAFTSPYHEEN